MRGHKIASQLSQKVENTNDGASRMVSIETESEEERNTFNGSIYYKTDADGELTDEPEAVM